MRVRLISTSVRELADWLSKPQTSYRGNRLRAVLCLILGERITLLLPSLGQRGLPLGSCLRLSCFKVRKATAVGQLSRFTAEERVVQHGPWCDCQGTIAFLNKREPAFKLLARGANLLNGSRRLVREHRGQGRGFTHYVLSAVAHNPMTQEALHVRALIFGRESSRAGQRGFPRFE